MQCKQLEIKRLQLLIFKTVINLFQSQFLKLQGSTRGQKVSKILPFSGKRKLKYTKSYHFQENIEERIENKLKTKRLQLLKFKPVVINLF